MASRRRARRYAFQLLYSLDAQEDACRSNLKQLSVIGGDLSAPLASRLWKPLSPKEESFRKWLQDESPSAQEKAQEMERLLVSFRNNWASDGLRSLWMTLLDPEEDSDARKSYHGNDEKLALYDRLIGEGVRREHAEHLVAHPEHMRLQQGLCEHCSVPRLVSHWVVTESGMMEELLAASVSLEEQGELLQFVAEGRVMAAHLYQSYRQYLHDLRLPEEELVDEEGEPRPLLTPREQLEARGIGQSGVSEPMLMLEDDSELDHARPMEPEEIAFAERIVVGVKENIEEIDAMIRLASTAWSITRMSMVDRSILRLSTYELMKMEKEIPSLVSIDEAIRMAQHFSELGRSKQLASSTEGGHRWSKKSDRTGRTHDGARFVNGILDRIAKEIGRDDLKSRK